MGNNMHFWTYLSSSSRYPSLKNYPKATIEMKNDMVNTFPLSVTLTDFSLTPDNCTCQWVQL